MNQAIRELGGLDIVVNNAAGNFLCPSANLSPNGFGAVIDIDAKGTWNVSRAAYHARLKDHGGQILNISATLHYGGTPGQVHVAAAKAAVDALHAYAGRRVGPARHPGQRHRTRADQRYRRYSPTLTRRGGRQASGRHPDPAVGRDR